MKSILKILLFSLLCSIFFMQKVDVTKAYGDPAEKIEITYPALYEKTYIIDHLKAKTNKYQVIDWLIYYLDTHSYFTMGTTQKKAFLQQEINQKNVVFWQLLPYVVQIETTNNWNQNNFSVDYFYKSCYKDDTKTKAQEAVKFFFDHFCSKSSMRDYPSTTSKDLFNDKTKWGGDALNTLYSTYWPDLANQRFRPYFTDQEVRRLNNFGEALRQEVGNDDNLGKACFNHELFKPNPELDDKMMSIGMMSGGLAITGEKIVAGLAPGTKKFFDRFLRGLSPAQLAKVENTPISMVGDLAQFAREEAALAKRFGNSGIPSNQWGTYDYTFKKYYDEVFKNSKGPTLKFKDAETIYLHHKIFVETGDLVGASAFVPNPYYPGTYGTRMTNHLLFSKNQGDINWLKQIIAHEAHHEYVELNNPYSYIINHIVRETQIKQGIRPHNPLTEIIADAAGHYNIGSLGEYSPGIQIVGHGIKLTDLRVGYIRNNGSYFSIWENMVNATKRTKNMSFDQAVKHILERDAKGERAKLINEIVGGATDCRNTHQIELYAVGAPESCIKNNRQLTEDIFGNEWID